MNFLTKPYRGILNLLAGFFLSYILITEAYGAEDNKKKYALKNWHHLDYQTNGVHGISLKKAYKLLCKKKSHPVIVAILDSGVDINHKDLKKNIWQNPQESVLDNVDNDQNGFVDDFHGWNFLTDEQGLNIMYENLAITRLLRQGHKYYENSTSECKSNNNLEEDFTKLQIQNDEQLYKLRSMLQGLEYLNHVLKKTLNKTKISTADINRPSLESTLIGSNATLLEQLLLFKRMLEQEDYTSIDDIEVELRNIMQAYCDRKKFGLNLEFIPRPYLEQDDYLPTKAYGNNDVIGPDAQHGTHIAGIIAMPNTQVDFKEFSKLSENVKLMVIRITPHGDENDKDIANGIMYAVKNGAKVINMSFAKYYTEYPELVQNSIRFAEKNDVVMIHSAGNEARHLDDHNLVYPNANFCNGEKCSTWIEVGASTWNNNTSIAASFTNYGSQVDVLAPGLDIYSTAVKDDYDFSSGSSIAAAVVSFVAATLRSYYPMLKAEQIVEIIKKSSVKLGQQQTARPNKYFGNAFNTPYLTDKVRFDALCVCGIVNLYNAIKKAEKMTSKNWIKQLFNF